MNFRMISRLFMALLMTSLLVSGLVHIPQTHAADHRDSLAVDALPEGDFTDVFAYVDPANNNNVILVMAVNPFTNPSEAPSARFGADLLYQFKINNNNAPGTPGIEDLVIQIDFNDPADPTKGRGAQSYNVVIGTPSVTGPHANRRIIGTTLCHGNKVYTANAAITSNTSNYIVPGTLPAIAGGGSNGTSLPGVQCFAGVTDDCFQTDVAQAVFRTGLNPSPSENALTHTQDVFRGFVSTSFGPLRGRPLRADGTSGVDGFGGYDATAIVVSLPKSMLRGTGIPGVSTASNGAVTPADGRRIGVWGTVSRPTSETFDGFNGTESDTFEQFERMGQQLANTVWIFAQPPAGNAQLTLDDVGLPHTGPNRVMTTAELKDHFNASGPETDNQYYSRYVPDSLTTTVTPGSLNNNIAGRALLLTAAGFATPLGVSGVSLLLPQVGLNNNHNNSLMRQLVFPDYLRLDLDQATDGVRGGAATSGTSSATLAIGKWGVQNGRRPADDVTDIYLRLARELTDVKFPDNLLILGVGVGGISALIPGAGPQGSRHTLQCTQLQVTLVSPQILIPCEDARIFTVLQGTDFIEQLGTDVENVANQVSQQRALEASFPYLGLANPVPGETGTHRFPPQN